MRLLLFIAIALGAFIYLYIKGWIPPSWIGLGPTPTPSPRPSASPSPAPAASHVIRIGVDDRASCLPASALSDFLDPRDRGVRFELVPVHEAPLRWQMLAAGRLTVAFGTMDSFVRASMHENCGAMIFRIGSSNGEDLLLVSKGHDDVRKLAGQKVATAAGSPGSYLMGYFLDKVGLAPSDVQMVEVDTVNDAAQLLEKGTVAGAWLSDPTARTLAAKGYHILSSTSGVPDVVNDICVCNHRALSESRSDVMAFMRAWFAVMNLLRNNPGLAREPIARRTHLSSTAVGAALSEVRFDDLSENQHLDAEQVMRDMRRIQEFWKLTGSGVVPPLDAHNVLDLDPLLGVDITAPTSLFGRPGDTPTPAPSESRASATRMPAGSPPAASPSPEASPTPDASPAPDASPTTDASPTPDNSDQAQ